MLDLFIFIQILRMHGNSTSVVLFYSLFYKYIILVCEKKKLIRYWLKTVKQIGKKKRCPAAQAGQTEAASQPGFDLGTGQVGSVLLTHLPNSPPGHCPCWVRSSADPIGIPCPDQACRMCRVMFGSGWVWAQFKFQDKF